MGSEHTLLGKDLGANEQRANVDDDREHHLAIDSQDAATLERILSPTTGPFADWGERGAICVIAESTGANRSTLVVNEVVEPREGDLELIERELGHELEFQPQYKRRAREAAGGTYGSAGLLYVHSHPERAGPKFSPGDLEHDRAQLYDDLQQLEGNSVALAAAVRHDGTGRWQIWRYDFDQARTPQQRESDAFGPESVERTAVTSMRIVGSGFEKRPTVDGEDLDGPVSGRGEIEAALQDSTIRLWGEEGQQRFAGLRVGVVGCGGGGSILAEVLPRMGIGELVLVDFDHLEPANANRHLAATDADVEAGRSKVEVSKRVAERAATCPHFEVRAVDGSIFENGGDWSEYDALEDVLDCDILVNAADPATVRCTMGRLAYAHLIPVIDGGTLLDADDGELTGEAKSRTAVAGPGYPCLKCAGQWTDRQYQRARECKGMHEGYADGGEDVVDEEDDARDPSAMPFNLLTEAVVANRLIHLVQGTAPGIGVKAGSLRLRSLAMDWEQADRSTTLRSCVDSCNRPDIGLGDAADLKRGVDLNLRESKEQE